MIHEKDRLYIECELLLTPHLSVLPEIKNFPSRPLADSCSLRTVHLRTSLVSQYIIYLNYTALPTECVQPERPMTSRLPCSKHLPVNHAAFVSELKAANIIGLESHVANNRLKELFQQFLREKTKAKESWRLWAAHVWHGVSALEVVMLLGIAALATWRTTQVCVCIFVYMCVEVDACECILWFSANMPLYIVTHFIHTHTHTAPRQHHRLPRRRIGQHIHHLARGRGCGVLCCAAGCVCSGGSHKMGQYQAQQAIVYPEQEDAGNLATAICGSGVHVCVWLAYVHAASVYVCLCGTCTYTNAHAYWNSHRFHILTHSHTHTYTFTHRCTCLCHPDDKACWPSGVECGLCCLQTA